jgi:hypothetical protein
MKTSIFSQKKIKLSIYIIFILFLLFACNDRNNSSDSFNNRHGLWIEYINEDGSKEVASNETEYVRYVTYYHGMPLGKVKDFYLNGKIQSEFELASGPYTKNGGRPQSKMKGYAVFFDKETSKITSFSYYDEDGNIDTKKLISVASAKAKADSRFDEDFIKKNKPEFYLLLTISDLTNTIGKTHKQISTSQNTNTSKSAILSDKKTDTPDKTPKSTYEKKNGSESKANPYPDCIYAIARKYNIHETTTDTNGDVYLNIPNYEGIDGGIIVYLGGSDVVKEIKTGKTGKWSCKGENFQVIMEDEPTAKTYITDQNDIPSPLKYRKVKKGPYTIGCYNTVAISQVQMCVGLTSSKYPRGSGYFDQELQNRLVKIGLEDGFTDEDVERICLLPPGKKFDKNGNVLDR